MFRDTGPFFWTKNALLCNASSFLCPASDTLKAQRLETVLNIVRRGAGNVGSRLIGRMLQVARGGIYGYKSTGKKCSAISHKLHPHVLGVHLWPLAIQQ
jgi:hypothetical protein